MKHQHKPKTKEQELELIKKLIHVTEPQEKEISLNINDRVTDESHEEIFIVTKIVSENFVNLSNERNTTHLDNWNKNRLTKVE